MIDVTHVCDELFGFVNVPNSVWIDERGMIVRPAEPAWPGSTPVLEMLPSLTADLPPEGTAVASVKLIGLGGASASVGAGGGTAADRLRTDRDREELADTGTHRGHLGMWWSVSTEEQAIAVTFDDGPTESFTDLVLALLGERRVRATFFVVGEFAALRPHLVERAAAAGHELGNHLWSHHSVATLDESEIRQRIARTSATIEAITGLGTRLVRPPKGHVTGAFCSAAALERHHVTLWSVTRGGPELADDDADGVAAHLTRAVRPGSIVNLHDGVGHSGRGAPSGYDARLARRRDAELDALPGVLDAWLAAGYRFLTVSDLIRAGAVTGTPGL